MQPPYDRSWWVEDGHLLGGCHPGSTDEQTTREQLAALLDAGMRTVISLVEHEIGPGGSGSAGYEDDLRAMATGRGIEIELHRFPIPDFGIAGPETIRAILDTIAESIARDRPVYLHCLGGHGRTGMIVGCRLREAGFDGAGALARITELRRHSCLLRTIESPETDAQRHVVRTWRRPHAPQPPVGP